tara:strand:- start:2906 stop:3532 length:627 start_codon:yes stop_codon:yes gene_type:complete
MMTTVEEDYGEGANHINNTKNETVFTIHMIMRILYENSREFPEGLYIKLCENLQKLYTLQSTEDHHDEINHSDENESDDLFRLRVARWTEYMRDYEMVIHNKTRYLTRVESKIKKTKPIQRMSKRLRLEAHVKGLSPDAYKFVLNKHINDEKDRLNLIVDDVTNDLIRYEQKRHALHTTLTETGLNVSTLIKYDINSGTTFYSMPSVA